MSQEEEQVAVASSACLEVLAESVTRSSLSRRGVAFAQNGTMLAFELSANGGKCEQTRRLRLPGEVFSSPVFVDGIALVGCRDDHVYALLV